jgi:arylsulfatase A-like enzyme
LFDAHMPYAPPRPFDVEYYDKAKDPRDPALPITVDERHFPPPLTGVRDVDYPAALYKGEVTYLDGELARLLSRPRFKRAIVAFTADHGESLGRHGVYWDHGELYPDSIHVPLIVAWPTAPKGARVPGPVDQLDVGRTLLDLSGLASTTVPGRSMTRFVAADPARPDVVHSISAYGFSASATTSTWHAILTLKVHTRDPFDLGPRMAMHQVELYELANDPHCENDLANSRPEVARQMRAEILRWLGGARRLDWDLAAPRDSSTLANLAGLGYVEQREALPRSGWFPESCACAECARYR